MILLDVNLLVYASDPQSPKYSFAKTWLDARLSESARVGIPWETILGFLRIVTNPRIYTPPVTVASAWSQAEEWLACPNVWIPQPGPNHQLIMSSLLSNLGGGAKLIPDAHLAALAIQHGLILCSADGDFARFPGLRWQNPIAHPLN
jgi:toxin-antitoxin system PIN domain toxin